MEEVSDEQVPLSVGPFLRAIRDSETRYVSGRGIIVPDNGEIVDKGIHVETKVAASVSK